MSNDHRRTYCPKFCEPSGYTLMTFDTARRCPVCGELLATEAERNSERALDEIATEVARIESEEGYVIGDGLLWNYRGGLLAAAAIIRGDE